MTSRVSGGFPGPAGPDDVVEAGGAVEDYFVAQGPDGVGQHQVAGQLLLGDQGLEQQRIAAHHLVVRGDQGGGHTVAQQ